MVAWFSSQTPELNPKYERFPALVVFVSEENKSLHGAMKKFLQKKDCYIYQQISYFKISPEKRYFILTILSF